MNHIVIDAREIYTTTGRYVERLIHYLQQTDQLNRYTILVKPKDFDRLQLTNPNFSKQKSPYKEFTLGEQLGFAKQLYSLKADLVHFGMTQQPLLYFKRSVTTIHDLTTIRFYNPDKQRTVFWIKQQIYKVVILWAAHKSKHVIVPSQFVADDLANYAKIKNKITVTHESADRVDSPAAALPYLQNKKFIMYIGRPTPHKNLDRLVNAFVQLRNIDPSLHLVLAGKLDTNYTRLKQRLDEEGQTNIIFTDFISDEELRWLYENTLVYCFPSLSEGFGLPGLEAMRYGAPVASSNATCLPEIYGNGALYFEPTNVDDMTATIGALLADPELRQKTANAGLLQAEKYSWQRMAEQTLAIYQKALN